MGRCPAKVLWSMTQSEMCNSFRSSAGRTLSVPLHGMSACVSGHESETESNVEACSQWLIARGRDLHGKGGCIMKATVCGLRVDVRPHLCIASPSKLRREQRARCCAARRPPLQPGAP